MASHRTNKCRSIAPKVSQQASNSNMQSVTTSNLQPSVLNLQPSIPNLQMTARPYFINDNFINHFNNFGSFQYDDTFQQDTKDVLVSIKFQL